MISDKDVLDTIRENVSTVNVKELDLDERLIDQGFDSLDFFSTLYVLEEKCQIKIPQDDIENGKLASVNAIVEYLNNCLI